MYGLWFVFKAVVVFRDIAYDGPSRLGDRLEPVFTEDEADKMKFLTQKAMDEGWSDHRTLLEIRDCCKIGRRHRYRSPMIDYFYPILSTK